MAAAYLSLTMGDDYGRTTSRRFEMIQQSTIGEYITAIEAFLTQLAAVTDLSVIRADLVVLAAGTAFAVTAGANVDVGATFSGLVEDGDGKKASMKVPGIKASLVSADGSVPITGAVAAWLGNFEDGEDWQLSDGEYIEAWIKGALDR